MLRSAYGVIYGLVLQRYCSEYAIGNHTICYLADIVGTPVSCGPKQVTIKLHATLKPTRGTSIKHCISSEAYARCSIFAFWTHVIFGPNDDRYRHFADRPNTTHGMEQIFPYVRNTFLRNMSMSPDLGAKGAFRIFH